MKQKRAPSKPREVTAVVSSAEVVNLTFVRTRPVEIHQRQDGLWTIHYPDPGFNPCDCSKKCRSETMAGPKLIQSSFVGTLEEARAEASEMGSIGELREIAAETHSERMQRRWRERREAQEERQSA